MTRKVKLTFFKSSGKYYAEDSKDYPKELQVYQIVDSLKREEKRCKGMHILLSFDEGDDIGYPCLILAEDRL